MAHYVELEFASKSDTGLIRSHNEDAMAISPECGLAILADGMGGYNAGEVASGIATSILKESLEAQLIDKKWDSRFGRTRRLHQLISESIAHTNASIFEAARLEPRYSGMGTTLVAAFFHYDKLTLAHIGDSRAYRFRENTLVQLTRDHSLLQEQIDAGLVSEEEAQFSQNKNLITRAMGVDFEVEIELNDHATQPGDVYLLCSDGLTDMLTAQEIAQILFYTHSNLELACNALVDSANQNGGRDNISVILIKVPPDENSKPEPGMLNKFKSWIK